MFKVQRLIVVLVASAACACTSRREVEESRAGQKEMAAHLERVERIKRNPRAGRYVPDPEKVYAFPIAGGHVQGPQDAWVTVVELADFQCGACSRVWPILQKLRQKYPQDVRLVFKHYALPIHARALPAARASECAADQNKFWPMHDSLMRQPGTLDDRDLIGRAEEAKLDLPVWRSCYESGRHDRKILDQANLAAAFGVFSTPAFYVNGRLLRGLRSFRQISELVDQELTRAKGSGLARSEYFARMIEGRGEKPAPRL